MREGGGNKRLENVRLSGLMRKIIGMWGDCGKERSSCSKMVAFPFGCKLHGSEMQSRLNSSTALLWCYKYSVSV